ncbi:MAG: hypothetical protein QOE77_2811 [Blastocatellia bacterium]|jgi:hypothetical protein|nr:hypothetical protein [Blastocatellia bacterium]
MKQVRLFCVSLGLMLALSSSVLAGDVHSPSAPTPCVEGQTCAATAPATGTTGLTSVNSISDMSTVDAIAAMTVGLLFEGFLLF